MTNNPCHIVLIMIGSLVYSRSLETFIALSLVTRQIPTKLKDVNF